MDYGELIEPGCTPGWVELSRLPSGVYILNLLADANPENRWILPFNQAIMKAFDALEDHLEFDAGDLPAALLTISQSPKFFSNGIDPTLSVEIWETVGSCQCNKKMRHVRCSQTGRRADVAREPGKGGGV